MKSCPSLPNLQCRGVCFACDSCACGCECGDREIKEQEAKIKRLVDVKSITLGVDEAPLPHLCPTCGTDVSGDGCLKDPLCTEVCFSCDLCECHCTCKADFENAVMKEGPKDAESKRIFDELELLKDLLGLAQRAYDNKRNELMTFYRDRLRASRGA